LGSSIDIEATVIVVEIIREVVDELTPVVVCETFAVMVGGQEENVNTSWVRLALRLLGQCRQDLLDSLEILIKTLIL